MITRPPLHLLLALAAPLALSCLDVAEGRARRDLEVGQGAAGQARVVVDEGLAAIRRIAPGELSLWASAPALSIRLTDPAGGPWTVTIERLDGIGRHFVTVDVEPPGTVAQVAVVRVD